MKNKKIKINNDRFLLFYRGVWRGILILPLLFLGSCIEDFDLGSVGGEAKIVIEGKIENGKPAEVFVLRSNPLSSDSAYSKGAFVTDAVVTLSDGITTEQLLVKTPILPLTEADSATAYYLPYKGNLLLGVPGRTYTLTIIARPDVDKSDTKTYTATTTIPVPPVLDSVWWKAQAPYDTLGYVWAHFSEPLGIGNNYKWYAKRTNRWYAPGNPPEKKDRRYLAPPGSTFDDKFIDGKSFDFYYNRGIDPSDSLTQIDDTGLNTYFKKTDTIFIKFCTIDQVAARFYSTYDAAYQTNGNPFAAPVSIQSNINGGGLGVWAGFGCSYYKIVPQ